MSIHTYPSTTTLFTLFYTLLCIILYLRLLIYFSSTYPLIKLYPLRFIFTFFDDSSFLLILSSTLKMIISILSTSRHLHAIYIIHSSSPFLCNLIFVSSTFQLLFALSSPFHLITMHLIPSFSSSPLLFTFTTHLDLSIFYSPYIHTSYSYQIYSPYLLFISHHSSLLSPLHSFWPYPLHFILSTSHHLTELNTSFLNNIQYLHFLAT